MVIRASIGAGNHQLDQPLLADLGCHEGAEGSSAIQDRYPISYGKDLSQPVADEENGMSRGLQGVKQVEETLRFRRSEQAGRFIEDQDLHLSVKQAEDFDLLQMGKRKPCSRDLERQGKADRATERQ